MNTTKFNDWLQIAASIGVITGLIIVAYEIRISNRIGVEQATAESTQRWETLSEFTLSAGVAELFVRAHEGGQLTRADVFKLKGLTDTFLTTIAYDLYLAGTGSWETPGGSDTFYDRTIQWYLGNEFSRRQWEVAKHAWEPDFVAVVDRALAGLDRRDVIGELDYVRGANDQLE